VYLTAASAAAVIGGFAFILREPVPLLDWFDLGIHELGHLIAAPLPELVMFMAGSFAQVAFPLAMAAYFFFGRRDWAACGFCLAWTGTSAWDVSVYMADASSQSLPLIGGGTHDWAYILGHYNAIDQAGTIAGIVEKTGLMLVLVGIALCLLPLALAPRKAGPGVASPRRRAYVVPPPSVERRSMPRPDDPTGDPWLAGGYETAAGGIGELVEDDAYQSAGQGEASD
jgi:hypothetical protein